MVMVGARQVFAINAGAREELPYWSEEFRANYVYLATLPMEIPRKSENQRVKDVVASIIRPGDGEMARVTKVTNWMMDNLYQDAASDYTIITYTTDGNDVLIKDSTYEEERQEFIDALLISRRGACLGFSLLLEEMMGEAGIAAPMVDGVANGGMGITGHAWNVIQINGKNLPVDITWATNSYWKNGVAVTMPPNLDYVNRLLPWALDRSPEQHLTYAMMHTVRVSVNGRDAIDVPALNVGGNNFVKLSCLAAITDLFAINYDGANETAFLSLGRKYAKVGDELVATSDGEVVTEISRMLTVIDGDLIPVATYMYAGNHYCKLRDLTGLGYFIGWDGATQTIFITF
jgi:hypothetical protein